jgi:hypothetical protein
MLVFIDESGCPGFKIARGSDPIFAVGMVIFEDTAAATVTGERIKRLHSELGHKPEFKFSNCSFDVRDRFFAAIVQHRFTVRALVAEKDVIYSEHLRTHVDAFYSFFVKELMKHDAGLLLGAKVRIDGSGGREFKRSLNSYLRRELGDRIRDVRMVDSQCDPLMQLADMCIGAIARAHRDRPDAQRWLNVLRPRIRNIWPFR